MYDDWILDLEIELGDMVKFLPELKFVFVSKS